MPCGPVNTSRACESLMFPLDPHGAMRNTSEGYFFITNTVTKFDSQTGGVLELLTNGEFNNSVLSIFKSPKRQVQVQYSIPSAGLSEKTFFCEAKEVSDGDSDDNIFNVTRAEKVGAALDAETGRA